MTDYNNSTTATPLRRRTEKPAAPELTQAAAMRMQRNRFNGMTAAEMCRAMDAEELEANAKRGGLAAIAEEAYRAGNIVMPDNDLDLGV